MAARSTPAAGTCAAGAAGALLASLLLVAAEAAAAAPEPCRGDTSTLRCAARGARVTVGVGIEAGDPEAEGVAAQEFDAITTQGSMLWSVIHPERERWDFAGADRTVAWAQRHGLAVTASHFVWDQILYRSTPAWVKEITDPRELRRAMRQHLHTVSRRYGRRIRRWIVVNEPLQYLGDTSRVQENHFSRTLGPDWIARTFRIARRAAPHAQLWLNEIFVETDPAKALALVELARALVAKRVPIDGVGIQGHLFTALLQPTAPDAVLLRQTMADLAALGLEVGLTEVDAPVLPDTPDALHEQARRLRETVGACLAVRRCRSITFWDLHDGVSWLNGLFGRSDLSPTLFDAELRPKPAFFAVRDALAGVPRR